MADGFVDEAWYRARVDDYLAFATRTYDPGSVPNVLAHVARARRDPDHTWDPATVTLDALAPVLDKLDAWRDTGDFDLLDLTNLWHVARDRLQPELVDAIERRLLGFRYWYTEPRPGDRLDHKWFWSENHRIIFHTLEYLVGRAFPDARFANDGRAGRAHVAHARPLILRWCDERERVGFVEWHSNVYMQKNVDPLLALVEWTDDEEIATRASATLDRCLLDIALHLQRGAYGATHGRSYKKDKNTARHEDTWDLAKLLFDDTRHPYRDPADQGAVGLALSSRYRLPEAIRRIATSDRVAVDRERHGVALDPTAPLDDPPTAPPGVSFDDEEHLAFWWSMGAWAAWPIVPLTLRVAERDRLWETDLFRPHVALRDLAGGDPAVARRLAQATAPMSAAGLLPEVCSYTWRAPEVMLSTAQDHRPGQAAEQVHAWQATLDADAQVFTTHPRRPTPRSLDWADDDGYWTGTASMPRSAQHERVGLHLYAPAYDAPDASPLERFAYEPSTHAFFPRDHFDEVEQREHWVCGRLGDGYVGLWSWRTPSWRVHDPAEVATNGMVEPFDLVAEGGADNVWIVEVGRRAEAGSFRAFVTALATATVEVAARPRIDGRAGGFDVRYRSPAQGEMRFGTTGPLVVAGTPVPLDDYPRMDNPWAHVPHGDPRLQVRIDGFELDLDPFEGVRHVAGPRA